MIARRLRTIQDSNEYGYVDVPVFECPGGLAYTEIRCVKLNWKTFIKSSCFNTSNPLLTTAPPVFERDGEVIPANITIKKLLPHGFYNHFVSISWIPLRPYALESRRTLIQLIKINLD